LNGQATRGEPRAAGIAAGTGAEVDGLARTRQRRSGRPSPTKLVDVDPTVGGDRASR
jgi:hypothetical protein